MGSMEKSTELASPGIVHYSPYKKVHKKTKNKNKKKWLGQVQVLQMVGIAADTDTV